MHGRNPALHRFVDETQPRNVSLVASRGDNVIDFDLARFAARIGEMQCHMAVFDRGARDVFTEINGKFPLDAGTDEPAGRRSQGRANMMVPDFGWETAKEAGCAPIEEIPPTGSDAARRIAQAHP